MLAIQVRRSSKAEEELAAVGVFAAVGHAEGAGAGVFVDEVFVFEFGAVDAFAAGAVHLCEVAALGHEAGDDAVEGAGFEVERFAGLAGAFGAGAEGEEVFGGFGGVGEEDHFEAAYDFGADFDVEEDSGVEAFIGF